MRQRDYPVMLTHEPGGTPLGETLRRWLKGRRDLSSVAELSLFVAARAELVQKVIQPALKHGVTVISDRYTASTVAYQGYGRDMDPGLINQLNQAATGGLHPDLTVLLDLPVEASLCRKENQAADTFEAAPLEFHRKVRQGYLAQASRTRHPWLVLEATEPKRELSKQIWAKVQPLL